MSRRIALPGADELFRSTGEAARAEGAGDDAARAERARPAVEVVPEPEPPRSPARSAAPAADATREAALELAPVSAADTDGLEEAASSVRTASRRRPRALAERRPSGRERHDEKITVYVSADELMDLEHARLMLRGDHGLPVDRGRVVREALAVVLADFEAKGEASILVRRLRGR